MKPVRVGLIGLGYIIERAHLPALAPLAEDGQIVFQAFCDLNEETLKAQAEKYKPNACYTDFHAMLDKEELDAVYLCIPPTLHTDELPMITDKGIALFVEKPQTLSLKQAVEFNALVEKSGIITQVGFVFRYEPSSEPTRELLQKRVPRHAQIQNFYSGQPIRYWTSRYELCGGSFVENTIHNVDLMRYFLGDIEAVSAFYVESLPEERIEPMNLPHVYNVNYRFAGRLTVNASVSRVMSNVNFSKRQFTIVSDDSIIEWTPQKVIENGEVVWQTEESVGSFVSQARAFIKAVQAGDASMPRSPYVPSLNSLAAVMGANASAESGGQLLLLEDLVANS
jgi:myo-inositol 2-dehydrogenase/D-chiro-inositol 1-dehydrogenase